MGRDKYIEITQVENFNIKMENIKIKKPIMELKVVLNNFYFIYCRIYQTINPIG